MAPEKHDDDTEPSRTSSREQYTCQGTGIFTASRGRKMSLPMGRGTQRIKNCRLTRRREGWGRDRIMAGVQGSTGRLFGISGLLGDEYQRRLVSATPSARSGQQEQAGH